jgi:hypothetical protein
MIIIGLQTRPGKIFDAGKFSFWSDTRRCYEH